MVSANHIAWINLFLSKMLHKFHSGENVFWKHLSRNSACSCARQLSSPQPAHNMELTLCDPQGDQWTMMQLWIHVLAGTVLHHKVHRRTL